MKKFLAGGGVAVLAACLLGCAPPTDNATGGGAEYPETGSSIELLVPFAAGGTTDVIARSFAPLLGDALGTDVTILNVPGAESQIGLTQLAAAAPDGYTIGFTNIPSALTSYLSEERGATYDRQSFVPLGRISQSANFVAVNSASSYQDLTQLLDAAAAAPGTISMGVASDSERVALAELARLTGAEFNSVPFDGGGEKATALLGSQVDAIYGGGTVVVPNVLSGAFRALAVADDEADAQLPDVPTFPSRGIDLVTPDSLVLSAPAGTPESITDALSAAIEEVTGTEDFQGVASDSFQSAAFLPGDDVATLWQEQEELFRASLGT